MSAPAAAIDVRSLSVSFGYGRNRAAVLKDVSFTVPAGLTVGLVGESGSGKSTVAKAIVGLVRPQSGSIQVGGRSVNTASASELMALRRRVQMIPQDPYASLNPRRTVGQTIAEAIDPRGASVRRHRDEITEVLNRVALDADVAGRYPADFSGGQRQRIAIARALAVRPEVIIADEVTSALDCSVQAEVLGVLRDLQRSFGLSMLFISHDLAVVRHVSDHVAVLYQGQIVEQGGRDEIFHAAQHPYTRLLLDSVLSV